MDYFSNLNNDEKNLISASAVKYFIPRCAVWNPKSLSTPCRLVFDASQGTKEGCSIDSLLAKGANRINWLKFLLGGVHVRMLSTLIFRRCITRFA